MASAGRSWYAGDFPCLGKPCCLFRSGFKGGRLGSLAMVAPTALPVWVVSALPSSKALIIKVRCSPAGQWDSKMAAMLDYKDSSRSCSVP